MGSPGLTFGPFSFDPDSRLLKRDGIELPLPPRVGGVLEVLLCRAGAVVPRQELIESVWKDAFVTDTSLAEAVSVLRQTLGDDPQSPSYIQTLHRRGYRFVAPVEKTGAEKTGTLTVFVRPESKTESVPVFSAPISIPGFLLPWSITAACVVLAVIATWQAVRPRGTTALPVTRLSVAPVPGTRFDTRAPALALSPDTSRAIWSGCDGSGCRLYLRTSDRLQATPLPGTDGAAAPFFSPDGNWVGFFADGHLKKIALTVGAPVTLADAADPLGAVWTERHGIIYGGAAAGLTVVPETGGETIVLTTPQAARGEVRHLWPSHHEDADLLLFTVSVVPQASGGRLAALTLNRRAAGWSTLIGGVDRVAAVAADALVFSRGAELQAVPFDARRLTVAGTPRTVLSDLATDAGAGQFAVATAGGLLTLTAAAESRPTLFWWTRPSDGDARGHTEEAARVRQLESPSLSPDGRRAAGIDRTDASRSDIWITDLERGTASRLTHGGVNVAPVWSADGTRMFFASSDGGPLAIYSRDADALQPPTELHRGAEHAIPCSASADGSLLAFVSRDPATRADVWGLPLKGGPLQPLIRTPFDDIAAAFSADGRLIAYQSNDAGRWDVYLHRRADSKRVTVSAEGGTSPFWSADGRSLFFRSQDRLMRATVALDGSSVGPPQELTAFTDAAPVGTDAKERILFQRRAATPAESAVLTLHWVRELRQILGPPSAVLPR